MCLDRDRSRDVLDSNLSHPNIEVEEERHHHLRTDILVSEYSSLLVHQRRHGRHGTLMLLTMGWTLTDRVEVDVVNGFYKVQLQHI